MPSYVCSWTYVVDIYIHLGYPLRSTREIGVGNHPARGIDSPSVELRITGRKI
jgi:hypothetical protein